MGSFMRYCDSFVPPPGVLPIGWKSIVIGLDVLTNIFLEIANSLPHSDWKVFYSNFMIFPTAASSAGNAVGSNAVTRM